MYRSPRRHEQQFEWGPLARGVYWAMIASWPLVCFLYTQYAGYYILLIIFCGFGLRRLIEVTGVYVYLNNKLGLIQEKHWQGVTEKRRREVDAKAEIKRINNSYEERSKLPKNW